MGQAQAGQGALWEIVRENPLPSLAVTTFTVSLCPSCFSTPTAMFFSSSYSLHLSIICCTHIKVFFFKATFQFCDFLSQKSFRALLPSLNKV